MCETLKNAMLAAIKECPRNPVLEITGESIRLMEKAGAFLAS